MSVVGFYKRPTLLRRRVYDPLIRLLIERLGFQGILDRGGSDTVQVLRVRGRRSGRWYHHPVGVCVYDGDRHVVGFYGQTEWARNLRAGSEATLQIRDRVDPIRAVELRGTEKAEFMRWLVGRYRFIARAWLKVNSRHFTDDDLGRLMRDHPVFRVETRQA
jgi:deazaflavin-dependent oxidoreductase (nitroreductase family)